MKFDWNAGDGRIAGLRGEKGLQDPTGSPPRLTAADLGGAPERLSDLHRILGLDHTSRFFAEDVEPTEAQIRKWVSLTLSKTTRLVPDATTQEYLQQGTIINTRDPRFTHVNCGDVCPNTWVPKYIEGKEADSWFGDNLAEAKTFDDPDIVEKTPYWRARTWKLNPADPHEQSGIFLAAYPEILPSIMDPNDEQYADYKKGQTSTSESGRRYAKLLKQSHRRAARAIPPVPTWVNQPPISQPEPEKAIAIAPRANIFLRPAGVNDMGQIMEIHNYMVNNSVNQPEVEASVLADLVEEYEQTKENGLHGSYLVAVSRTTRTSGGRGGFRGRHGPRVRDAPGETVVGYAKAFDEFGRTTMYRWNAVIEIWVREGYQNQGVGRSLMDRLLHSLDPDHKPSGPVDFVDTQSQTFTGGTRNFRKIYAHLHAPSDTRNDKEGMHAFRWQEAWLEKLGFVKTGNSPRAAHKCGKWLDHVTFEKDTANKVDAACQPVVMDWGDI